MDKVNTGSPIRETLEAAKRIRQVLYGVGEMKDLNKDYAHVKSLYENSKISKDFFTKFQRFYNSQFLKAEYRVLKIAGADKIYYNSFTDVMWFSIDGKTYKYPSGTIAGYLLDNVLPFYNNQKELKNELLIFFEDS